MLIMVLIMAKRIKAKQYRIIEQCVKQNISANKIQKLLQKENMGLQRKVLLVEIRTIKKVKISPEKRKKHIPKKYREEPKPVIAPRVEPKPIYRISFIIPSLPYHSRPFNRNYLGFRLTAFSYDRNILNENRQKLRLMLIRKTGNFINSISYAEEQVIRVESPVLLNLIRPEYLNGKWFFAVEKEGKEQYGENGLI